MLKIFQIFYYESNFKVKIKFRTAQITCLGSIITERKLKMIKMLTETCQRRAIDQFVCHGMILSPNKE